MATGTRWIWVLVVSATCLVYLMGISIFCHSPSYVTLPNIKPKNISVSETVTSHQPDDAPRRQEAVVPNIIHFIWFGVHEFSFLNHLAVRSVHQFQKPKQIYFHCDNIPTGRFWHDSRKFLSIRQLSQPGFVFNRTITQIHHQSDVARLQILLQHGGIYLDTDVITVRSLNSLRHYDVTMGKEIQPKLNAGVILGRPNSKFLKMCLDLYRDFNPSTWDTWSASKPYALYKTFRHLVHVEDARMTTPDWLRGDDLWNTVIPWRDLYVIHVHHENKHRLNPESIRRMRSTFGEVARHVFFGSSQLLNATKQH